MGVRFRGWGIAVPDRIVTNDELSETLDTSDEWIIERTGIHERRIGGSARTLGATAGHSVPSTTPVCTYRATSTSWCWRRPRPTECCPPPACLIANDSDSTVRRWT
jgi:hypothetical protein